MTACACIHNIYLCSFDNFQQRLLHAFAAHIPGDGHVFTLAAQFVYFIYIHDPHLRPGNVPVSRPQETLDTSFRVCPHISVFRHRGRIGDGKGYLQYICQRFDQRSLAYAGRAQHQDVALFNRNFFFIFFMLIPMGQHFVMVVYCNGQNLLRPRLAYDVPVQILLDFFRV